MKSSKSAFERKKQTEKYLQELGIPINEYLPTIEEEDETVIRSAVSIAKRILILTYLSYVGEDESDKPIVVNFLKSNNLWEYVSPEEKEFFTRETEFTDQEQINISWKSECIWILLWILNKFEKLELPILEARIPEILEYLPEFMSDPSEFINSSNLKTKSEILDKSDLIYRLHWASRNADLNNNNSFLLNSSILQERHYAINWATNYEGLEWDEITTDT